MVPQFLFVFFKSPEAQQREFLNRNVPLKSFGAHAPQLRWIYDYYHRHGSPPNRTAFESRFPDFSFLADKGTLQTALQPILDNAAISQIGQLVSTTRAKLEEGGQVSEILAGFKSQIASLHFGLTDYQDLLFNDSQIADKLYRERVVHRSKGDSFASPTPWNTLNELIGFWDMGEVIIVAARPNLGKTWITIYWADFLDRQGSRVLFVSKEMPTGQVESRFESLRFKLDHTAFRKGTLPPKELRRWRRERASFKGSNLVITGEETITGVGFEHVEQKIEQYRPDTVVIDGAYLLTPPTQVKYNNDVQLFASISRYLKRLAKARNIRIIGVIQANRESENTKGETSSKLRNLYGADAWAQDSDYVLIVNGMRGGSGRVLSLEKGRESGLGDVSIQFKLDPPYFGQLGAAMQQQVATTFEGV